MARIALTVLLLTSLNFAQDQAATARTAAGCGPKNIEFSVDEDKTQHPVAQPEPGKALVYVFAEPRRDPMVKYIGGITTRVGIDGAWMGANRRKSYFYFSVEPGEHRLCSDMQSTSGKSDTGSAKTFSTEAGKTYYFRATLEERFDRPSRLNLEQVDSAEGMFLLSSSAFSKYTKK